MKITTIVRWIFAPFGGGGARVVLGTTPFGGTDPNAARLLLASVDPFAFQTDPDAARLVSIPVADPSVFETDPNAARMIVAAVDPHAFQTDPDAARLVLL